MRRLQGLFLAAVRAVDALKPAIGALDLAGVSWRRLRGFQRGTQCLADCGEGHTYGPWCQLGWPLPGPTYLINALAEVTMPLPSAARELEHEQLEAIHEALFGAVKLPGLQLGTSWLEALETPVDTELTVHHPACVSWPDDEGKAGPCDCGAEP